MNLQVASQTLITHITTPLSNIPKLKVELGVHITNITNQVCTISYIKVISSETLTDLQNIETNLNNQLRQKNTIKPNGSIELISHLNKNFINSCLTNNSTIELEFLSDNGNIKHNLNLNNKLQTLNNFELL